MQYTILHYSSLTDKAQQCMLGDIAHKVVLKPCLHYSILRGMTGYINDIFNIS